MTRDYWVNYSCFSQTQCLRDSSFWVSFILWVCHIFLLRGSSLVDSLRNKLILCPRSAIILSGCSYYKMIKIRNGCYLFQAKINHFRLRRFAWAICHARVHNTARNLTQIIMHHHGWSLQHQNRMKCQRKDPAKLAPPLMEYTYFSY